MYVVRAFVALTIPIQHRHARSFSTAVDIGTPQGRCGFAGNLVQGKPCLSSTKEQSLGMPPTGPPDMTRFTSRTLAESLDQGFLPDWFPSAFASVGNRFVRILSHMKQQHGGLARAQIARCGLAQ